MTVKMPALYRICLGLSCYKWPEILKGITPTEKVLELQCLV
jgi:hypothetical protein